MATHQKKLDRYALLAALAERQTQDGLRTSAPMILPVAVSPTARAQSNRLGLLQE
jgi:hypothetical protein